MHYKFEMIKQKSFIYKFDHEIDEVNFFVNETNYYAFNALIHNNSSFSFLYGPKKSGKSYLGQIWQKKNNALKYNNNHELFMNKKKNIFIYELINFDE